MHETEALKALEEGWAKLGVEIDASISTDSYKRKNLHLARIEVAKGSRGQGLGTKAMEDLVALAEQYGLLMTLSPSTDFGASSKERLKRFYRRFGFVSNKGRHKDFSLFDSMYRVPRNKTSHMGSGSEIPKLYHGTLVKYLPEIREKGLEEYEGWGGAGTVGVFLSGTPQGALYWAKMKHQMMNDERVETHIFDRDHGDEADELIAVLEVEIPESEQHRLKADQEQFEDVMADFSPDDWRQSLQRIGDVRFDGQIPPQWIRGVILPSEIRNPVDK